MAKKDDHKQPVPAASELPNTALADLLREKGFAEAPAPAPAVPKASSAPAKADDPAPLLARAGKIVLRREKKGRGGKTVTIVSGLDLRPAEYELLARALRKGLGCGSIVEGKIIVLQGDIQQRAESWLRSQGATKIVLGN